MYLSAQPRKKSKRSALVRNLLEFGFNTGLMRLGRPLWASSLAVLNYHRIGDLTPETFQPNVSASAAMFERQMQYLARWFKVISVQDLHDWLQGRKQLPAHAALITFDDGYLDNYVNAYPILRKYNFPAVIFLTVGHIETDRPFFWDLTAYCFAHSQINHILFPDGTERSWLDEAEMQQVSKSWIESLKTLSEDEKQNWVNRLPERLGVSVPAGYFRSLMMSWEQAREMSANGVEFGGHTIHHPILTRILPARAREEMLGSVTKIGAEIGKPVTSFAYPNGMRADFNETVAQFAREVGCLSAYTLLNGPTRLSEVRQSPYAIRRSFISHLHSLPEFCTLLHPVNRLRR